MSAIPQLGLVLQVIQPDDGRPPFIDASVQVWRDQTHLNTVKVLNYRSTQLPQIGEHETLEQWAFLAARTAVREMDEALYHTVNMQSGHQISDYASRDTPV
jgi:hypothetical protein